MTFPTKATQANSLQIDEQHLCVETINIFLENFNVLILWCAACLDRLFVKNLLLTSEIFTHQFAKNLLLKWVTLFGVVKL